MKTRQSGNIVNVTRKSDHTAVHCSFFGTETSGVITFFSSQLRGIEKSCVAIFVPGERTTYACDELTSIEDIIAKYTSTEKGKKAFAKAEDELHKELHQQVLEDKLNRVKCYRLINNMDQKTLAALAGLKQPNISRIERIGYSADAETYQKIAKVFKINYKELLP